jgi:hypothetical protein
MRPHACAHTYATCCKRSNSACSIGLLASKLRKNASNKPFAASPVTHLHSRTRTIATHWRQCVVGRSSSPYASCATRVVALRQHRRCRSLTSMHHLPPLCTHAHQTSAVSLTSSAHICRQQLLTTMCACSQHQPLVYISHVILCTTTTPTHIYLYRGNQRLTDSTPA